MSKRSTLMRVCIFLSALSVSLLLLTSRSALPAHAALSWSVQTVDENAAGYGNGYNPIVVDSNNTAHIAYTRYVNGTYFVMYASWNGSGWSTQTVAEGFDDAFSLVLDASDNPHILYSRPFKPLMYASWTGSNWTIQNTGIKDARYGTLAVESFGNPHIAYTDGKVVRYANWTGSNWNIQTVDTASEIPFRLSFALDSNNTPYIMYSPSSYMDDSQAIAIRAINVTLATYKIQVGVFKLSPCLPQQVTMETWF